MEKTPTVYILAKGFRSTLYTGVTSDLLGRIHKHREELTRGYASHYGIKRLVWFETGGTMESAIAQEKRIKRWRREWKYALIEKNNPTWRDMAEDFGSTRCRQERQTPAQGRGDVSLRLSCRT